jgi:hypothetical protein
MYPGWAMPGRRVPADMVRSDTDMVRSDSPEACWADPKAESDFPSDDPDSVWSNSNYCRKRGTTPIGLCLEHYEELLGHPPMPVATTGENSRTVRAQTAPSA